MRMTSILPDGTATSPAFLFFHTGCSEQADSPSQIGRVPKTRIRACWRICSRGGRRASVRYRPVADIQRRRADCPLCAQVGHSVQPRQSRRTDCLRRWLRVLNGRTGWKADIRPACFTRPRMAVSGRSGFSAERTEADRPASRLEFEAPAAAEGGKRMLAMHSPVAGPESIIAPRADNTFGCNDGCAARHHRYEIGWVFVRG